MSSNKTNPRLSTAGRRWPLKKSHIRNKSTTTVSKSSPAHATSLRGKVDATKPAAATLAKKNISHTVRESSKLARVIALLRRKGGVSIAEMSKVTGWQAHSIRGAISGIIKKKLGLAVSSKKIDGIRTYRIVG